MIQTFSRENFEQHCTQLGKADVHLQTILDKWGHPPMWSRPATFTSLLHIILEQQVSLASAKAALNKLKEKIGRITPQKLMKLSEAELKACYFSRQKTVYARELAGALINGKLKLRKLNSGTDEEIRQTLTQIKGIGNWTVDVYLIFVLQRTDIFPVGDLAMVKALKEVKQLPGDASVNDLMAAAEAWRPHRTIATMLLWHHYIKTRNIKL